MNIFHLIDCSRLVFYSYRVDYNVPMKGDVITNDQPLKPVDQRVNPEVEEGMFLAELIKTNI